LPNWVSSNQRIKGHRQNDRGQEVESRLGALIGQSEAEGVAEISQTVEPASVRLLADYESRRGQRQRLRDNREIDSANPPMKQQPCQRRGEYGRNYRRGGQRERAALEGNP
jgi:hypothetical protein